MSKLNKANLISFFNNSSNFDGTETTWNLSESQYILRFYNKENNQIGKVWWCLEDCGMTESKPFSPNMKYSGLSETGKQNLKFMPNEILTK